MKPSKLLLLHLKTKNLHQKSNIALEDFKKTVSMQIILCFPLLFICHTLETDSGPEQMCSREAAASANMETLSGRNQQNSELIRPSLALKDGLSVIECKLSGGNLTAIILVLLLLDEWKSPSGWFQSC